ncbi:MAG TPA: SRPBCC family protein [Candidatus Saccharimonadales bacterium]|nr:SRPBCC family protein [Candidatus Saccharimonadales bacterium]
MAHADYTVTVNKSAALVFNFLVDGLNNPKWRDAVIDISLKSGVKGTVGAEYSQTLKGPGGRRIAGDYKLTAVQPNSHIGFVVTTGPARPTGDFSLKESTGKTSITFSLDYQTKGLAKLMEPMITKTMKNEVACLDKLKQVLEGTS